MAFLLGQCTDCGVPETIGYLKYICRVFQNDDDGSQMESMREVCNDLVKRYDGKDPHEPVLRISHAFQCCIY